MALVLTNEQNYENIANNIRAKNGTTETYTPEQMSTAISELSPPSAVLYTEQELTDEQKAQARENIGIDTSSHSHSADAITSGVFPVARGGTGHDSVDTTPTSGSTKMVTSDGIYTALSGKAASSHGTHVTFTTDTPKVAGTASVGTATTVSRSDHVHPVQTSVGGNAGTATKLETARTIDGVSFDGSAAITHFGTCSTAAATAAKTVACTGFTLVTGARIVVQFTVTNTAAVANLTLNVNNTGAKSIKYRNGNLSSAGVLAANRIYEFVYDGSQYEVVGDLDSNTTYYIPIATCTTAGETAAKTCSHSYFSLDGSKHFMIMFKNTNTAQSALTLDIANTGAKPIYINSNASSSDNYTIPAGVYPIYFDGTNYHLRTDIYLPGPATSAYSLIATLGVGKGGTGATTHITNAILTGNGTGAVQNVATASGALYATTANGAAKFGTLPIAQGGTGATSAANARTSLGVISKSGETSITGALGYASSTVISSDSDLIRSSKFVTTASAPAAEGHINWLVGQA